MNITNIVRENILMYYSYKEINRFIPTRKSDFSRRYYKNTFFGLKGNAKIRKYLNNNFFNNSKFWLIVVYLVMKVKLCKYMRGGWGAVKSHGLIKWRQIFQIITHHTFPTIIFPFKEHLLLITLLPPSCWKEYELRKALHWNNRPH